MKKTVILLSGILVFILSGLVSQSATNKTNTFNHSLLIEEKDPPLEVEEWMTDSKIWNQESISNIQEEQDEELNLEDWMIDTYIW